MSIAQDILSYIEWVQGSLMLRQEMQEDRTWPEFNDGPREIIVQNPGEVEPPNEIDQYLPEYVGLLDVQLYWPQTETIL